MKTLIDVMGYTHYLTDKCGEDGQGVLYNTKNNSIIIRYSPEREADREIYDDVKLMPLSAINNILLPSCYLKEPSVGYTLNIPEGFVPLTTIMLPGENNISDFYTKTGGLKRRLGILMNLAKIFAELHSMPVMYGSISADRILISKEPQSNDIYLLYSVQLSYAMNFKAEKNSDPYVAPEAKLGKRSTISSDIYTFAALAYDVLTLNGALLSMLTDEMYTLFDQAKQPKAEERPSIISFYKIFMKTLDLLLVCKNCYSDMYFYTTSCPNCNASLPKLLKATIYDKISKTRIDRAVKILEFITTRQCFWNYHTENTLLCEIPQPTIDCILNISKDKKLHLIFKNLMDKDIKINSKLIPGGQCYVAVLPFDKVIISIKLHASTERFIELVML